VNTLQSIKSSTDKSTQAITVALQQPRTI